MKQRKKDFLKRRKLRRRGRPGAAGGAEDGDDDLEARLLHDAHKPKFGEQAMAPLKVAAWCSELAAHEPALSVRELSGNTY